MEQLQIRLKRFLKSENGDGIVAILVSIFIALFLALIAVTIMQYTMIKTNLKTAANETLQIVKVENGADTTTKAKFDALLEKMGMNPSLVEYSATPKLVQRGDEVQVTAIQQYNVFALKVIGVDYTVPIKVQVVGLAHKYIREGGD